MSDSSNNPESVNRNTLNIEEYQYVESHGSGARHRSRRWVPPTDIFETEEAIVIRIEIAGMQEDDFIIELRGKILSIRGVRRDVVERRACYQMMIPFGEFGVEVRVPSSIDRDKIEAVYNNGFLRLVLPKPQPRQISVDNSSKG